VLILWLYFRSRFYFWFVKPLALWPLLPGSDLYKF